MSRVRVGVAFWGAFALGACATAPPNPPADSNVSTLRVGFRDSDSHRAVDLRHQADVGQTTVPGSLAVVWATLPSVLEQLEIVVSHVDPGSGTIGNPGGYRARRVEGERMSRWLDCGRGLVRAVADEYQVTLAVMVRLLAAEGGNTVVRTTVDAYARDRALSGGSVHCISWGTLERRVGELVVERLAG